MFFAFTGIPTFIVQPPSTLNINEGSNLVISIRMNGNPQPSAHFRWTHLPTSSTVIATSMRMSPSVYSTTYLIKNIDGKYCGRILQTTIRNSVGSSPVKTTNINVLCKYLYGLSLDFQSKAQVKRRSSHASNLICELGGALEE